MTPGLLHSMTDTANDRIYSFSVSTSPASVIQVSGYLGNSPLDVRVVSEDRQPLGLISNNTLYSYAAIINFIMVYSCQPVQ